MSSSILSICHEKAQRSSVLVGDRMQFGVHVPFGAIAWVSLFQRRLAAVRCVLRDVASIIVV